MDTVEPHSQPEPNPPAPGGREPAREGLSEWVKLYWNEVFSLLYRMGGCREDAEDLTQETFLRAFERRESFTEGTNRRAWLKRIAANAFVDLCRRKRVAKADGLPENGPAAPEMKMTAIEQGELNIAMETAIAELAQTPRMVFLLRAKEDLSFKEIAQMLNLSEENARWHMMQARRHLLTRLDGKL